ncbi:MAG: hypothetical protein LBV12_04010 [Puniceicoccales bacterium]|jgi:pyruvate dehydrogenase E1 component alpha subunit|nr:hypothetical protein [Puniceicoccales bacterium]
MSSYKELAPKKAIKWKNVEGGSLFEDSVHFPLEYSFAKKFFIYDEPSSKEKIQLYKQMIRVRYFELEFSKIFKQGIFGQYLMLSLGQEVSVVGIMSTLSKDEHVITGHRDHAQALISGMSMNECMAELMGKTTGCSKGKGGTMHFFSPKNKFWGGHGIVGSQVPLGTGIAFALKYQKRKGCCICYMGDRSINQGAVHEALNLASLWKLPIIFIIENNNRSINVNEIRPSETAGHLRLRAKNYNMPYIAMNGHNLYDVHHKMSFALSLVRRNGNPLIAEVFTYRYAGNSENILNEIYKKITILFCFGKKSC